MAPTQLEDTEISAGVDDLLGRMSLAEKVGQLCLVNGFGGWIPDGVRDAVREGRIGAVLNEVDVDTVNELQRLAEESRLGIPLLVGRDVIHGFKTVFPIPLGQAASWNPEVVRKGARVAAVEAASHGVNWTFAPMIDIGRDPRWGRVAETLGEDPYLTSVLTAAMIAGFQGEDLTAPDAIAACAKHFAGYGASEAGRDYASTNIPENELRNVHLPPFQAAVEAGVASFMTSFSDIDGIPASASHFLLRQILREEWWYDGFVVSDWDSIPQLAVHGLTEGDRASALAAASAGVDMEMASTTYAEHLESLVVDGLLDEAVVDVMVRNVLRAKARLGLFDHRFTEPELFPGVGTPDHLEAARVAAREACVLLKNDGDILPLEPEEGSSVAVIGPLADDGYEQLGTWIFDGDPGLSITPLQALRDALPDSVSLRVARGTSTTRSRDRDHFDEAVQAARDSDVALLFLGEESILSGEAHCRADIGLPGNQADLLREVAATGTPTVLVLLTGRPLALLDVVDHVDAILCAWHPGSMGGPAIVDLVLGAESPSGRLPVTFPKMTGQIPIYYAHRNTGKPATEESMVDLESLDPAVPQLSVGNTSFHLDAGIAPLFPFGHGLGYSSVEYYDLQVEEHDVPMDGVARIKVTVANTGSRSAVETVQLYVRDPVASITRPVRELKGFQRVHLEPGARTTVRFRLAPEELSFEKRGGVRGAEPGIFHVWVGGSSEAHLRTEFRLLPPSRSTQPGR